MVANDIGRVAASGYLFISNLSQWAHPSTGPHCGIWSDAYLHIYDERVRTVHPVIAGRGLIWERAIVILSIHDGPLWALPITLIRRKDKYLDLLSTVKIESMTVPELVQKGNVSAVILDCDYSVEVTDLTLQWMFNRNDVPVYEWRPHTAPTVRGPLEGRLDLTYRISQDPLKERRALRVLQPDETLSGEYTCVVSSGGSEARQTRSMLVFSPQHNLSLHWHRVWEQEHHHHRVEVACLARGVYPQPNLILEHKHAPVDRQQQRVWRSGEGLLLDAKTTSVYRHRELCNTERFTCRLEIPDAGYVAITEKLFVFRNSTHDHLLTTKPSEQISASTASKTSIFYIILPSSFYAILKLH